MRVQEQSLSAHWRAKGSRGKHVAVKTKLQSRQALQPGKVWIGPEESWAGGIRITEARRTPNGASNRVLSAERSHKRGSSCLMQDYQRRVEQLQREGNDRSNAKEHTIFKLQRTVCKSCGKCGVYRGNFSRHPQPSSSDPAQYAHFLHCLHCRCPMNSHATLFPLVTLRPMLWDFLKDRQIRDEHLEAPYIVVAWKMKEGAEHGEEIGEVL